ncbi:glycerophosphodiester phosphodiesterase [Lacticaseibacillus saniviri]
MGKLMRLLAFTFFLGAIFAFGSGFTILGHRGETYDHTQGIVEHSFASYDRAVADGADYIELDLRQSSDGVLVVSHDETTKRLTGIADDIQSTPWSQLQRLLISKQEHLHSFEQILTRYARNPKVRFMIETHSVDGVLSMELRLVELVKKYGLTSRVYYESFVPNSLARLKALQPQVLVMLLVNGGSDLTPAFLNHHRWVNSFGPYYEGLSRAEINRVHAQHQQIYPWFSNRHKPSDVRSVVGLGVDGVFTNWTFRYTLATRRQSYRRVVTINIRRQCHPIER